MILSKQVLPPFIFLLASGNVILGGAARLDRPVTETEVRCITSMHLPQFMPSVMIFR